MIFSRSLRALLFSIFACSMPVTAQQPGDALQRDAQALAAQKGIVYPEALRRMVIQEKAVELITYLTKRSQYIDSVIESSKDTFKIHIYVKQGGIDAALTAPMLRDADLQSAVQIEARATGTEYLRQVRQEVLSALSAGRMEGVTKIDIRANRLIVQVRDPARARALLNRLGYGETIVFERRELFPRPVVNVGGGALLSSSVGNCTSRFGAYIGGSTRGILCPPAIA